MGPKKTEGGPKCERSKFPKNNDMCIELYVFRPGKSEFNVDTMIGRTIFNKGPFYEPEGPILKYKTSYIDMGIKVKVIRASLSFYCITHIFGVIL